MRCWGAAMWLVSCYELAPWGGHLWAVRTFFRPEQVTRAVWLHRPPNLECPSWAL
jgi:hypothetical protein